MHLLAPASLSHNINLGCNEIAPKNNTDQYKELFEIQEYETDFQGQKNSHSFNNIPLYFFWRCLWESYHGRRFDL